MLKLNDKLDSKKWWLYFFAFLKNGPYAKTCYPNDLLYESAMV